ncbi:hypothetical protein HVX06_21710 (plasmid) [Enterobacter sp. RHB15-C17]|uniref:Uncharacterized protein n=1 Tax=Lelliottia amnigena TaxID=61646 RepID=A0AAP2AGU6_LELAM|nr:MULTISPECIES: hypothetical protein [Enterobacteriaceae]MBL5901491.1 hypothetical protein [Lelliottia amnigena]MBL5936863.1 hypothetical protein [Lelliottia amnigena]NTZ41435.1 hypothetical protein [Enterobacter sp. JMULE2]QMM55157.1 hypothetical protein HVX06_21710 [Enterobacter sp. RHB15-C17]
MKKDPDGEKGRNVAVTAVRHDEKSASRLDDILQENPLFYPSIVLRAGILALHEMTCEQRMALVIKAALPSDKD